MAVVALSDFVVVAHHAYRVDNECQPVLEIVGGASYRRRNSPKHQLGESVSRVDDPRSRDQRCLHVGHAANAVRCVVKYSNEQGYGANAQSQPTAEAGEARCSRSAGASGSVPSESQCGHEIFGGYVGLPKNAGQSSDFDFTVQRNNASPRSSTHDDVTAGLACFRETQMLQRLQIAAPET
jgi:hypothetical protein